jgi:hypothetical protein
MQVKVVDGLTTIGPTVRNDTIATFFDPKLPRNFASRQQ